MDQKTNIKKIILKYNRYAPEFIIKRELKIPELKLKKAKIIVGPRRAGKTYVLYGLMKNKKEYVFINFEDNLFQNNINLNLIPEASKELFENPNIFIFDEIQEVNSWEQFIVSLLNENKEVFITGSNSKLLSKEIATSLRGKAISFLLLPFSFKEFISYKNIKLDKQTIYSDKVFKIKKLFHEFLKYGGFPEIVLTKEIYLKNKIINEYFNVVLYKDLSEKLKIKNTKLLEITLKYMLNLYGNYFSITKFENYLKSIKIPYSLEDIYKILKSLEDVFFVSYVKKYAKSYRKNELSKSKIYLFDQGYINFLSIENDDKGRILENIVFIELFRRKQKLENNEIFYYSDKNECDFIIKERDKITQAIQVCYNLNEENRKREINGLLEAMYDFNLKQGIILTYDQEEELKINNKKIKVMPVWKWLLG